MGKVSFYKKSKSFKFLIDSVEVIILNISNSRKVSKSLGSLVNIVETYNKPSQKIYKINLNDWFNYTFSIDFFLENIDS